MLPPAPSGWDAEGRPVGGSQSIQTTEGVGSLRHGPIFARTRYAGRYCPGGREISRLDRRLAVRPADPGRLLDAATPASPARARAASLRSSSLGSRSSTPAQRLLGFAEGAQCRRGRSPATRWAAHPQRPAALVGGRPRRSGGRPTSQHFAVAVGGQQQLGHALSHLARGFGQAGADGDGPLVVARLRKELAPVESQRLQ